jgi:integrase/recombinase XerD
MSAATRSSRFERAVARYLAHKRALGHRYRQEAWLLGAVGRQFKQSGHRDLDSTAFECWSWGVRDRHPNTRRKWQQIIRNFCVYRRRNEPACFVPSADGCVRRRPYVTPIIVEPEQIARMLAIASALPVTRASPLRAAALRLAVVLLYTCGLRLGELLRLTVGDVEDGGTVLRIRESKFHKSRLVPLSPSATMELGTYLQQRHQAFDASPDTPLLCNRHCGPLHSYSQPGIQAAICRLFDAAGIRDERGRRPRVHDLRHSFAVQALIRWYREGADVQSSLPKLALYMGHVSIESSAYYLHWVPTVRELASHRFEERFGSLVQGGVP